MNDLFVKLLICNSPHEFIADFCSFKILCRCPYQYFESSPILCITTTVENIGNRPSRTVPQLYLEFPAEAEQPVPILKGFHKTTILQPKDAVTVTFPLTERDLSYWGTGGWTQVKNATAHLAESSASFLASISFELPQSQTSQSPLSLSSTNMVNWMIPLVIGYGLIL